MARYTCRPDRYMNETEMSALFDESDTSLKNGQSTAALFSSLVNSVRQVYMSALFETREELLEQSKEHARELAALKLKRGDERVSLPQYHSSVPERATTCGPADPVASWGAGAGAGAGGKIEQAPEREITWPAITFPLHIGSYTGAFRRDTADWKDMNRDGWTERLVFKVFKFEEPGTFKVTLKLATTSGGATHVLANREPCSKDGWKHLLEFYAYSEQRPGTDAIWVAYHSTPERCIFLKGDRTDIFPDWERTFEFWVPM